MIREYHMPKKRKSPLGTNITIAGNSSGQIAIGDHVTQIQSNVHYSITPQEVNEIRQILKELRAKVEAMAKPEKKDSALERVEELEQAITEKKPDLSKMEKVKKWFSKNVPTLVGAVTSVIVHPIVGKLVEAGGDLLVKEFQEKFGSSS